MAMLTEENIAKFQEIYKARFGKEISSQQASIQGLALLTLVRAGIKAYPKPKQQEESEEKSNERREDNINL
jgi:hypothetical protein